MSEKALCEVVSEKTNYSLVFANEEYVKAFNATCLDQFGFVAGDEKLQEAFVEAEARGTPDVWKSARANLGIALAVKAEGGEKKGEGEEPKKEEEAKKEEEPKKEEEVKKEE